mmetsp:Transcript_5549/g.18875  ORF Transcript_5549/g.18875 Transcript_5549/m.18875 type:complete len:508 (-) Transcript_5549:511-2034(-)
MAIKRALVLQLVGGAERTLMNGCRLRGDINVLLVGDPSTAKSQLLRATMRAAPIAVSTTGRGSSGVGLTAAIAQDSETGDRRLEAGAVVLADRGVVCIDEFDKMSTGDRIAIHEVMEQQTVTIAKAGIHASLNARCAVLAAANPIYGQYDTDRRPQDNIGLPDSLLSRFDLLFIVLDNVDASSDREVADHVLRSHRLGLNQIPVLDYHSAHKHNLASDARSKEADVENEIESTSIWQIPHRGTIPSAQSQLQPPKDAVLHPNFLRKYVHFARQFVEANLNDDARQSIANAYADLRIRADESTLPVTARCLEALIRLSTAHAKVRLSSSVNKSDCVAALELLSLATMRSNLSSKLTSHFNRFALHGDSPSRCLDVTVSNGKRGGSAEVCTQARGAMLSKRAFLQAVWGATKRPCLDEAFSTQENKQTFKSQIGSPGRSETILRVYSGLLSTYEEQGKVGLSDLLEAANSSLTPHELEYQLSEVESILRNQQDENRLMYDELNGEIHFL